MPKFRFNVAITEAVGSQTIEVEATTQKEAEAALLAKGGEIVAEEIEVQGLAWHTARLTEVVCESASDDLDQKLCAGLAAYREKFGETALKDYLRGFLGCVLY